MTIAGWTWPVLAREADWSAALVRLVGELDKDGRARGKPQAAIELGEACEHVDPDRRRAIAAYARAGAGAAARAFELAVELAWWPAAARFAALAGNTAAEAEAWLDAGNDELARLAHGPRGEPARGPRTVEALAAALAARPDDPIAGAHLLSRAAREPNPALVHTYLKLRLGDLEPLEWVDAMRGCAFALVASVHHRGFGLRLARFALERAYEHALAVVPGHLALWSVLAGGGSRRELLPLAVQALDVSHGVADRVWIAALAAEISLREGQNAVVAGRYADIVAEHAPDHPIMRTLVVELSRAQPSNGVPAAAVAAASELSRELDVDVELGDAYAAAADAAVIDAADLVEEVEELEPDGSDQIDTDIALLVAAANKAAELPAPAAAPAAVPAAAAAPIKSIGKLPLVTPVLPRAPSPRASAARPKRNSKPIPSIPSPIPKKLEPVLAALRQPERPLVAPRPPDPPNAIERARRISIPIDVRLELADGRAIDTHSRDISTSGLFLLTDVALDVGAEIRASILLPGPEPFTEDTFSARVRIVRKSDGGYGVELVEPEPPLLAGLAKL